MMTGEARNCGDSNTLVEEEHGYEGEEHPTTTDPIAKACKGEEVAGEV